MEQALVVGVWVMQTCSKYQATRPLRRPPGIKTSNGVKCCILTMRPPRKCLVCRAIPNYGKRIMFSGKLLKSVVWETPFVQQMSVRISVKQDSLSLIHFLEE